MKWKIITSEYLSKKNWLTIRKDRLELPNGKNISEYFVLEYPDIANVIAVTQNKKFVMVEQYRHGIQSETLELCGGTCRPDEDPLLTIQRELLEETGYGNGKWRKNARFAVHPIANNNYTHCFIAEDVELLGEQQTEDNEIIKVRLLDLSELKQKLYNGEIIQPSQAASLYKYLADKNLL